VTSDRPGRPELAAVIALLYRASFQRFSFTADIRERDLPARRDEDPAPGTEDWFERSGTVAAGPDGRYRAVLVDEEDEESEPESLAGSWDELPFGALFRPSWLLAEADLEITGETERLGRAAYEITGRARPAASEGSRRSAGPVAALVDAELGILLEYERTVAGGSTEAAAFTSLTVAPVSAETLPGPLPELSDDQVNLLYRTSLGPQRFSAELHEWADPAAVLRLSVFGAEQGLMASAFRKLMPADDQPEVDLTARLQVAMPGSYRLDARYDPGRHPACTSCDGNQLWQVYPDRVVVRPAAGPPTGISLIIDPIWLLSGYRLSVAGRADYGGRPSLRLTAVPTGSHWSLSGPLSGKPSAADRIEADIDTELGIIVRQDWHYLGQHVLSAELAKVTTDVGPAAFAITPAPGVKVVTAGPLGSFTAGQLAGGLAKGAARMAADLGIRWLNRRQP
jgi:hypothetical protein